MATSITTTSILNHLITAILLVDADLNIHYANNAAEQLLRYSQRRLQHQPLTSLIQHSSLTLSRLPTVLEGGDGLIDGEVTLVIDQRAHQVTLHATPFTESQQRFILIELKPINQHHKIDQDLRQHAQQQAAKELIRGLAHEIKNPLGGLRGAAQLLEKQLQDVQYHEYTQMIIRQADRLRNLVDRLLGPQKHSQRQKENIHQVLERVRQLVDIEHHDHLHIIRDYDPSLPNVQIDSAQIEQAILNIVSNAALVLQEQDNGTITLRTRSEHQVIIHGIHHKLVVRIDIIDNGPGIPEHLKDIVFYPMVSGRSDGTGLGLSIAQNLVDQHQGKIEMQSHSGHTQFTLYLPLSSV